MTQTVSFDFSGASVIVTGGTSGIGHATAEAFLKGGARVLITGTRGSAGEYESIPKGAEYRQLNLESPDSVARFAESVDRVDVLVNNAGHTMPQAPFATTMQVNLMAVHDLSMRLHEKLKLSRLPGGASVVNGPRWAAGLSRRRSQPPSCSCVRAPPPSSPGTLWWRTAATRSSTDKKFRWPWVSGREIERLPELGSGDLVIAPWLHLPRDMRTLTSESKYPMRLDIKRKVLERYAAEIRSSAR